MFKKTINSTLCLGHSWQGGIMLAWIIALIILHSPCRGDLKMKCPLGIPYRVVVPKRCKSCLGTTFKVKFSYPKTLNPDQFTLTHNQQVDLQSGFTWRDHAWPTLLPSDSTPFKVIVNNSVSLKQARCPCTPPKVNNSHNTSCHGVNINISTS